MAFELHIVGPGLDSVRAVQAGDAELILGRDTGCSVHLPDPERNVSRRHLALWVESGDLYFRVLSTVNGVDMPFGYAPPGAQGVLPVGQRIKVGDYSVSVRQISKPADQDPWAVLERGGMSSDATLPRAALVTGSQELGGAAEEDPFDDWGFDSTFGPGSSNGLGAGQGAGAADLSAFYKGLGLDTATMDVLSAAELEASGRAVRAALEGLFALYASRSGEGADARGENKPVAPVKDNNPLKTQWPEQSKLHYVFGGRAASIGFINPQRALTEIVSELLAHDAAVSAATKAALEGTVQEFAPAELKAKLLGTGTRLFEGSRAWEAYSRYYGERSQGLADWVQQLLDKYFTEAYLRESQRIKRETGLKSG